MDFTTILVVLVILALGLGVALWRASRLTQTLRSELLQAREAQRSQDTLLTKRSELDHIKDEFISDVSHELRTPLTSIHGALGLLSAGLIGNVDEKAQHLLRIAVNNTDRLIRLINDILDLERMESGRAVLQLRRCSLRDLAQQAIETMTPLAAAAQVKLDLVLAALPEAMFFDCDPDRIMQVLDNLLSNAIKFSPPAAHVEIRVEANADSVVLRVSDQGRGIPVDKLESVFERFLQVENADAHVKGGTGLGLAICKTIIQQHKGTIWAESNHSHARGPGASLIFTLPRVSRVEDVPSAEPSKMVQPGFSTIILCDDDPSIRMVVGESLRLKGYEILEAEDGEHAIELAVKNRVRAILLDLYMPGITGWETVRRLKDAPNTADIPIVILSVRSPAETSSNGPELIRAAQAWVQKPFNERVLLGELARVLDNDTRPARVLLVEDDGDLARNILAGLEDAKVCVDHARTRQDAIELTRKARPDLIILDLDLSADDGFSLIHSLRQHPDMQSLPLVVYSEQELSDIDRSRLQLGTTEFLSKARLQPHDVKEIVLNIVHRLRARTPLGSADPRTPPIAALADTTT